MRLEVEGDISSSLLVDKLISSKCIIASIYPHHGPRAPAWGFEVFEVDKTVDIFDPLTRNRSGCNTIKHVS